MTDQLALRVAVLKVLSEYMRDQYNLAREAMAAELGPGDRVVVRSPLDQTKIGPVYMTDPKPVAAVVDGPALVAWMQERYPESVETGYELGASTDAIVGVLFEHAPYLLREIRRVRPPVLAEIRQASAAMGCAVGPSGEADIPGVGVSTPDAVVVCRPSEHALLAVKDLFEEGRLELDGSMVPELPERAA